MFLCVFQILIIKIIKIQRIMDTKTTIMRLNSVKCNEKLHYGSPKNENKFKRTEKKCTQQVHLTEKNPNTFSFGIEKINSRTSEEYEELIQTLVKENYRLKQDIVQLKTKQMLFFDQKKIKKLLNENQQLRSQLFFDQQKIKKLVKLKMRLRQTNSQLSKRCQQLKNQLQQIGYEDKPLDKFISFPEDLNESNLLQSHKQLNPSITQHFCYDESKKEENKIKEIEKSRVMSKNQKNQQQDYIGNTLKRVRSLQRFSNLQRLYYPQLKSCVNDIL